MKSYLGIIAGAVICLSACGDSDSGTKGSDNGNSATPENAYATEENLPGCIGKYEGEVAYVEEDNSAYKCEDGRWENKGEYLATSEDIKNCTVKREGTVAYIADKDESLVCRDGKWVNKGDYDESRDSDKSSSSGKKDGLSSSVQKDVEGSSDSRHSGPDPESSSEKSASNSSSSTVTSSSSAQKESSSSVTLSEESSSSVQSSSSLQSSSSVTSSSSSSLVESSSSLTQPSSSVTSSSSTGIVPPCKTETEDNCEYGVLKDSRDGKEYKTVKIGGQWWMAENLNFDPGQGRSVDFTYDWSWCYDNDPSNCDKYGRLYTWAAAMDSLGVYSKNSIGCGQRKTCTVTTPARGICPEGWHIPTSGEWKTLYSAMGESPYAMQAKGYWSDPKDTYGFAALPVGDGYGEYFHNVGVYAYFWSATEFNDNYDYAYRMNLNADGAYIGHDIKYRKFAVRCIKD